MNTAALNAVSVMTNGNGALQSARMNKETSDFAKRVKKWIGFKEEPMIVFIVHESPSNKCSEREVLLKYFADNHIDCCELEYPINSRDQ